MLSSLKLSNRVVLITGAGRGIGRAIAEHCARAGAKLCLAARTESELQETADLIARQGFARPVTVICDVVSESAVARLFAECDKLGPLDGIVCAAGIYGAIGPLETCDPAEWRQAIEVNLFGTFNCAQQAVRRMKPRRKGKIVFMSGGGEGAYARFSAYVSSKGAIWRLCETLAAELTSDHIDVNAIAPGAVATRLTDEVIQAGPALAGEDAYAKALTQKKDGATSPDKAGELATWLLSSDSDRLTGKILSAVWDDFEDFTDLEAMSKTNLYKMRRVVHE